MMVTTQLAVDRFDGLTPMTIHPRGAPPAEAALAFARDTGERKVVGLIPSNDTESGRGITHFRPACVETHGFGFLFDTQIPHPPYPWRKPGPMP